MRRKPRHRDYEHFRDLDLKKKFPWIASVRGHLNFLPAVEETWCIKIWGDIAENQIGKEKFEQYIREFFSRQRKNSVIFCWRHTSVIIIVFK